MRARVCVCARGGQAKTFFGKSNYWTTGNTLNPTNKDDLMNVDAKYAPHLGRKTHV